MGELPECYDHKYTYSHIGYNLKSGDIQAAIGVAQLERLDFFVEQRRSNFFKLSQSLEHLSDRLILPRATKESDPSWFGFPLTVKGNSPRNRNEIVQFLNVRGIGTRLLFAGNLIRQPAFIDAPRRVVGELKYTDQVMKDTFWIGVWPGLADEMLQYTTQSIEEALK